jgi:sorting nexin-29
MSKPWLEASVISIYKKGDRSNCENYRGISLINVGYKICAKIINKRLQTISDTLLLEEQNGFQPVRSCTDNAFTIKQIIEKRREQNLEKYSFYRF